MKLVLKRYMFSSEATLGRLYVIYGGETDEKFFGYTVEDQDRGLIQSMPLSEIQELKVMSETAIPYGTYSIKITWSNKYKKNMPQVLNVPGFEGIRIHPGNTEKDTAGCLLPGLHRNENTMSVTESVRAFNWLFDQFTECEQAKEPITIEIKKS